MDEGPGDLGRHGTREGRQGNGQPERDRGQASDRSDGGEGRSIDADRDMGSLARSREVIPP